MILIKTVHVFRAINTFSGFFQIKSYFIGEFLM